MRLGTLFAAGCFGILGYWYVSQSAGASALLMFALAAGLVVVGVLPPGRLAGTKRAPFTSDGGQSATAQGEQPVTSVEVGSLDDHPGQRTMRTWRIIAVAGLATSIGSAFVFPPLSLVLAALAMYALHRVRRERILLLA